MPPSKRPETMASQSDDDNILFIKYVPAKSLEQRLEAARTKLQELKLSVKENGRNSKLQPDTPLPFGDLRPVPLQVNIESSPPVQSTSEVAPTVLKKPASRKRHVRVKKPKPIIRRDRPLKRKIDLKWEAKKINLESDPEMKRRFFERIFGDALRQARAKRVSLRKLRRLAANIPQILDDRGGKKIDRANWRRVLKMPPVIYAPKSPETLERESSHVAAILAEYSSRRVSRRRVHRATSVMSDIPPPK